MSGQRHHHHPEGFTLLEILTTLLILVILTLLILPNYGTMVRAAQQVVCASHMRSIHVAMDSYLADNKMVWPQGPSPQKSEEAWKSFWIRTLEPYDIDMSTWHCPVIRGLQKEEKPEDLGLHYVPTLFDPTPNIAYRWPTQPWLIEVADAHGKGPLICFPDGSVKPFYKVLAEQGQR